jgi:subtilisin family serine protease
MKKSVSRRRFLETSLRGGAGAAFFFPAVGFLGKATESSGGICVALYNHWSYTGIGWQLGLESCVLSATDAMEMADRAPHVKTCLEMDALAYKLMAEKFPEVAAEANTDNYICYDGTCAGGWGGTSFAAPSWAGHVALANQQAAAHGDNLLGFINPAIYTIGLGSSYSTDFHDITSGSNGTHSAVKGYDLVTGWGSPNGTGLIAALVP